jgi:hypothetical protein
MATTTPNFGWPVPTSTDLVKNGATAIEALGDAIDASLVDLEGGTTGQVLAKASNTDMDFAWVAQDDSNAIQNTIVDAKGDLISASAADVPARLAVGSNGETLVADSSTSTGLRYQTGVNLNGVIGGGFDWWQRGTSFTVAASTSTYTADRWLAYRAATGMTVSRQSSGLTGFNYCARIQRDNANTSTTLIQYLTNFETIQSIPFAGQTVTLSFYARKGANYSQASSVLNVQLITGTGTDQNALSGFTGGTAVIDSSATVLTTSWQRFSYTVTLASSVTQLATQFYYVPVGTAGAADYAEVTGVQLEMGSVATTFKRAGGTLQGELAACQRYYFRATPGSFSTFGSGVNQTTTASNIVIPFPVTMRTAPSGVEQTGTASDYRMSHTTATTCSAVPVFSSASINQSQISFTVASGLSSGGAALAQSNASTAYLGWSAEL